MDRTEALTEVIIGITENHPVALWDILIETEIVKFEREILERQLHLVDVALGLS